MKGRNNSTRLMNKAMKKGMSPIEVAQIKELARKEADRLEKESSEKAFLRMLAIPLVLLANDYWEKTAKRRIPKFIDDVMSLYESVAMGIVTDEQLAEELQRMAGVSVEAEWLRHKEDKKNG